MRTLLTCCFLLSLTLCLDSVNATPVRPIIKYGKVDASEFAPTLYSVDSAADAVFLFDKGKTYFDGNTSSFFSIIQERHARVRLLHKKAFDDMATIEIRLYTPQKGMSNNVEQLSDIDAATYNLVNGKVEVTKLEKNNIFKQKDGNFTTVKFTFPNIKEGSIVEYHYKKVSQRFWDMDDWNFQGAYPRLWTEFTVIQPELFSFVSTGQSYHPYALDTGSVYTQNYTVLIQNGSEASQSLNVHCNVTERTWALKDVPSLKEEAYISSLRNYVDCISFQLYSVKLPDTDIKRYMNDWMQESKDLMENEDFGKDLNSNSFLSNDLQQFANNNKLDKVKGIYNFIRDGYASTDQRALYLSQSLKQTWKTKKGNVADINLLLTAAYRNQGLTAYPVLVGTRDSRRPSSTYPLMDRYNYVLCKVVLDSNKYFILDASDKHLGFNHLNTECYNGYGRTINPSFPDLVILSPDSIKESQMTIVNISNNENGKGLDGSYSSKLGNFSSQALRGKLSKTTQKDFFESERRSYSFPMELVDYGIDSLNNLEDPIKVHYSFKIENSDDDIIYFNPMMSELRKENPFKAAKRAYPVEMPFKISESYILLMDIPKGYEVDEMPKSTRVSLNENEGQFTYYVQKIENRIQVQCLLNLKKATFEPEDYNTLRDFFAHIVSKENEPLVFKKIK